MSESVAFADGMLELRGRRNRKAIPSEAVNTVWICALEDSLHQGEEEFHIVITDDEFILIGPFVEGADGAIAAMLEHSPAIPVEHRNIGRMPFRFRTSGLFGLRLFPIAGLKTGKLAELDDLMVSRRERHDGQ
ncbi:hypothetical protein [Erythrobacter sp. JK5]|uniref:hypothetical protein n=1 Tax=Erythrobacter sp. JK5 TaxID=2829500 RepID=UPI001BAB9F87|nr:hypothetical protein [Erythrobacter sp. JK5]QUL38970.1 hypothetical protein KDC96_06375 [Erythrobacter sp. JK5]